MIGSWEWFHAALSAGGPIAFPLVLVGGILTGLNPCCIALYPTVAATCCANGVGSRQLGLRTAIAFVGGTTFATTLMGLLAALAGHAVLGLGPWPRYAIAMVPLLMGTHLLGWLRLPLPSAARGWSGHGFAAAIVAGFLLALVIGSCGTPVLAAILAYAAYKGNLLFGAGLLFVYGLGNGIPLLLVGTVAGELARRAVGTGWQAWVERVAGTALLGLGFYLIMRAP